MSEPRPGLQDPADKSFAEREHALSEREEATRLREELVAARESAVSAREEAAKSKAELEKLVAELREANQHLVSATLREQTMTDLAARANRIRDEFLPMLAHELRNPLAPILNAVDVLDGLETNDPRLAWIHDVVKRQIAQMTRLLDDLLDLSRITSGKIFLQKRPVAIREFIERAIETSRPLIDARRQQLAVELPTTPLHVDGDAERLSQVFSNLLNNASKYTPIGGAISLSAERSDHAVVVRVVDNGSGIEADALPHVFELFTQENRSLARSQGGLGIGLSVVRNLVEMHGGTVEARSAGPDQGSEFVVRLPLVFPVHAEIARDADANATPTRQGRRIVVIEDYPDTGESLKEVLEMAGHEVSTAYDGVAGFTLVQRTVPDIVLCDIGLPGMDGYTVIANLREQMKEAMPFMVAITGYGQDKDRVRSIAAGFDEHLVKPISSQTLLQLIDFQANEFLERRNRTKRG